ncbi:Glycosyltransferase involved in cell wall bisynthesis [Loktanella fryxellensis]|uniref:Glycosyltransferase involved in cell wall bisynthesis n=1 Tax=Loktanella fryxellensis TaxID=245187 RepID=A0A1H7ZMR1_9RHOB|nr:glycosyltransferase family 4 protein [Loktanella fryxellensis]SEM58779.1 Glycosyltransferase involved in cell wall bisynthesis [Loktanella fryxellensis]
MMRIAYVCTDPGIPVFGTKGASVHVQEMLRAFVGRGAHVTVISPRIGDAAPADLAGVAIHALPPLPSGAAAVRAQAALDQNAAVALALDAAGPFDLIYERHALYAHAGMEVARDAGTPGVLEVNAPLLAEQARHRTLALTREAEGATRACMSAAAHVTAVSPVVGTYATDHGAQRMHVIPNAVTPARFPQQAAPGGAFTLGFLGSLKPWHDVDTALDAFALLRAQAVPDAVLMIVGDGPERDGLAARADALGIADAVEFTGAVAPEEVPGMLARMHVGLSPYAASADFYFSPLKIYEYMAAGLAVVASDVGHLGQVVDHGTTGLMVPPGDAQALADALARLAADPALRSRLGSAARAHVMAHHTWDGIAARVMGWAQAHAGAKVTA